VRRYYPTYLKTWLNLGEAWLKLGAPEKAREAFEQALGVNPFHPRPHQALAALYAEAGDAARAERAKQSLELLR
jgi:Tfp pilus assembly protein PilF